MHKLIIGNKNYSTWSLRGWLAVRLAGIDFTEILLQLELPDFKEKALSFHPAGMVPILILPDGTAISESLAICEYANEACGGRLYPEHASARATARAYAAEMHSGFTHLRNQCPMNIRKHFPDFALSPETKADVARIESMWSDALATHKGDFLFGDVSVADVMFAPVVMRFIGYDIRPNAACQRYMQAVTDLPAMQEWLAAAAEETWVVPMDEVGDEI